MSFLAVQRLAGIRGNTGQSAGQNRKRGKFSLKAPGRILWISRKSDEFQYSGKQTHEQQQFRQSGN
ncbi:hypothetical protein A2Z33_00700 [Candidatus Gottesmanbacteria bacterium RBG_16_52_11]|uniref:Uncharacterized protein n=1 Tax=Candidatus Gottesmanbacteria bacterium RBG_16_52_11 TaxID=1798374 RepID=A0A1F5YN36_9BACT|nr:MAG: hypothetical protein A2Z33_00700 [Candidatus Gottesmanbacteria bacterium RBG_16_52_11]